MWPAPKEAVKILTGTQFCDPQICVLSVFCMFCLQKRYFGENIHFQFRPTPYPLRNISEGSGNINNPSLILPLRKQKTHDGKHFPKQAYAVLHVRRHIVLKPIPTKDWVPFIQARFASKGTYRQNRWTYNYRRPSPRFWLASEKLFPDIRNCTSPASFRFPPLFHGGRIRAI